jgi:hypothetical protein
MITIVKRIATYFIIYCVSSLLVFSLEASSTFMRLSSERSGANDTLFSATPFVNLLSDGGPKAMLEGGDSLAYEDAEDRGNALGRAVGQSPWPTLRKIADLRPTVLPTSQL